MYVLKVCKYFNVSIITQYRFRVAYVFDFCLKLRVQAVLTLNWWLKRVIVDSNAICTIYEWHGHIGHIISKMTGQELQHTILNNEDPPQVANKKGILQEMHHKKQLPPTWHVQTAVCVCARFKVQYQGARFKVQRCEAACGKCASRMCKVQSAWCKVQSAECMVHGA